MNLCCMICGVLWYGSVRCLGQNSWRAGASPQGLLWEVPTQIHEEGFALEELGSGGESIGLASPVFVRAP